MKYLKNTILPIILAGIWINISEFVRNELFLKSFWVEHYEKMRLTFPSDPINGIIWGIWGFSFAVLIFFLSKQHTLLQTTLLSWFASFFMMWLVIWNLDVLPNGMLWFSVPLSLIEAFIGALIISKMSSKALTYSTSNTGLGSWK
jgi:hypothetical protein